MIQLDDWQHGKGAFIEYHNSGDVGGVRSVVNVMLSDLNAHFVGSAGNEFVRFFYPLASGLDDELPDLQDALAIIDNYMIEMGQFAVNKEDQRKRVAEQKGKRVRAFYKSLNQAYFDHLIRESKSNGLKSKEYERGMFWIKEPRELDGKTISEPSHKTWIKHFGNVERLFFREGRGRASCLTYEETKELINSELSRKN